MCIVLPQQDVGPEDPSIPQDLCDLVAFVLPTRTNPVRTLST